MNKIKGNKILCYAVAVLITSVLLAIAVCGHVLSRYAGTEEYTYNQITIDDFYFTVDILGDSVDTATSTKKINIYNGSATHTIDFYVCNYFDSLRITSNDITYTTTYKSNISNGATLGLTKTIDSKTDTVTSGDSNTISASSSETSVKYTLSISTFSTAETITVTIKSSSPFTKTLTLVFNLVVAPSDVTCSITSGSPYAELIIKTDIALDADKIVISWSGLTDLQFDNTNSFFTLSDTTSATSKALSKEQSVSVKFFNTGSTSYTAGITQDATSGVYTITITQATSG